MSFGPGKSTVTISDILDRTTEAEILAYYLGITSIPCLINSPLRVDRNPSMALYKSHNNSNKVYFIDYSTGERGDTFTLLQRMWGISYGDMAARIYSDISNFQDVSIRVGNSTRNVVHYRRDSKVQCVVREWMDHDIDYWESYGISLEWLKYAEVYPISHKIIISNGVRHVFAADKYAYAFVEHKDGKVSLKIYQPYSKTFKWCNNHDASVISLWTKMPDYGDKICICSSLKDALCLMANARICSIALQGEGYSMSSTAINELKRRFKSIYILFDNDKAGLINGKRLADYTGFINIILPQFQGGKDISDLMKVKGKDEFLRIILPLFKSELKK